MLTATSSNTRGYKTFMYYISKEEFGEENQGT